jgi:arylsulfatase
VSREYSPKFEFTGGEIVQVVFDVADESYSDAETRLASLMAPD